MDRSPLNGFLPHLTLSRCNVKYGIDYNILRISNMNRNRVRIYNANHILNDTEQRVSMNVANNRLRLNDLD